MRTPPCRSVSSVCWGAEMQRITRLVEHPLFRRSLEELRLAERDRIFCGHDAEHFLSVARLMTLMAAEEGVTLPRVLLYAAAFLHDIGRGEEYRSGTPHEAAALELARPILTDCGFDEEERAEILTAIRQHRSDWGGERTPLGELLYRADKKSRLCLLCPASEACNWSREKRNLTIEY